MSSDTRPPRMYVIAGPNGAGKTTFAYEFLPNYVECAQFVNADLIAQGLSPFDPEGAAWRTGRSMLDEINQLVCSRSDFAFETTLAGRSHVRLLREAKEAGYAIHLLFPLSSCPSPAWPTVCAMGGTMSPRKSFDAGLPKGRTIRSTTIEHGSIPGGSSIVPHRSPG